MSQHSWHKCKRWWKYRKICPVDGNLPGDYDDDNDEEGPVGAPKKKETKDKQGRKYESIELEPIIDAIPDMEDEIPTLLPPYGFPVPPPFVPPIPGLPPIPPERVREPIPQPTHATGPYIPKQKMHPWQDSARRPWDNLFKDGQPLDMPDPQKNRGGQSSLAPAWNLAMQIQNERNKRSSRDAFRSNPSLASTPNIPAAGIAEEALAKTASRYAGNTSYSRYAKTESSWLQKSAKAAAIGVAVGSGVKLISKMGGSPPSGTAGAGYHQKSVLTRPNLASAMNF